MGQSPKPSKIAEKNCSRWSDAEFVRYCQNELVTEERDILLRHLEDCCDCRERFVCCLEVIIAESTPQDKEADLEMVKSPFWDKCKREIARIMAGRNRYQNRSMGMMMVAAMVLLALVPMLVTYWLD